MYPKLYSACDSQNQHCPVRTVHVHAVVVHATVLFCYELVTYLPVIVGTQTDSMQQNDDHLLQDTGRIGPQIKQRLLIEAVKVD